MDHLILIFTSTASLLLFLLIALLFLLACLFFQGYLLRLDLLLDRLYLLLFHLLRPVLLLVMDHRHLRLLLDMAQDQVDYRVEKCLDVLTCLR